MKHTTTQAKQKPILFIGKGICILFLIIIGTFQNSRAQIAAWDFTGENTVATSAADIYSADLDASNLMTRGAGAAASAGANSFRTVGFQNNGISTANTDYFQITLSATAGNVLSLSTLDAKFAGTATFAASPGVSSQFAYSLNGTTFILIGSPSFNIGATSTLTQINLTGVSALQNVPASTTVTLRYYASGQTTTGGWGFNSPASGQYGLAVGGTILPIPTQLVVTTINPASPTQNIPFSVTVQSQDAGNVLQNVTTNTDIALSLNTGTGTLGGTLTGTITAGTNSVVISGVTYNTNESGVSITATRTSGDILTPGNSSAFIVQSAASPLITLSGTLTPFSTSVGAPSASQSYDVSGSNLTADILVTPPADFEIKTGANSFSTSPITLTQTGGTVSSVTIDVRYNPAIAGSTGSNIAHTSTTASADEAVSGSSIAAEPTTQCIASFGAITKHTLTINFSGGDGSSRIVVMRAASAVTYAPSDGAASTGVSNIFTTATDHGSGNKIVYDGTGNTVTVSGLTPLSVYHVAVYEYNGAAATANYLTASPGINNASTITIIPVPMATQSGSTYTEDFADIANWTDDFDAGTGAIHWGSVATNVTGAIPDGINITVSTATFNSSSFSGGVQRGGLALSNNLPGTIVQLSTGGTDNTNSNAIDIFLDFTGVSAGTLSFDWATVFNSTGDRASSLRVYTSINGTSYTELTGAAVLDKANNVVASGSITTVALPASFNGSSTARIRFYEYNATGGSTGSRAKISIDNVIVTATPPPAPPTHLAITNINPPSPFQNVGFSVTVQSQDSTNAAQNVLANTDFTLSLNTGTGTLGGTVTGTIIAGTNTIVVSGVTYNTVESGVSLTATRTAGDVLTSGNSSTFTVQAVPPPAITLTGTLNPFNTSIGTPSVSQSYTVAGSNLTADIIITPPSPFEISLNNSSWTANPNSITLTQSGGTVATTTIYVRYNPSVSGPDNGNISHTSTNAATQNESVSGTTIIIEPTLASTLSFGCFTTTSVVVNFTGGNGANRIVVARSGAAVSYSPADGTPSSGVNNDFSLAADQGSGNKIVYDGNGSTVTVSGLSASTTYYFDVYEYNGTGVSVNYLISSFGSGNILTAGSISYSITGNNYTQNFDGLPLAGGPYTFAGNGPFYVTQCPISASNMYGWQFGKFAGSGSNAIFTVSNGSATSGSAYSFGTTSSSERALGGLVSGTTSPNLGLVLTNNTSDILSTITISYTGEQWRNGGSGQPNNLQFYYAVNTSDISTGTFIPVTALNFTSPQISSPSAVVLDGNLAANRTAIAPTTFTLNSNWLPGQNLVLRWDVVKGGGAGDGLAIDDFTFSATTPTAPVVQDSTFSFTNISTVSLTANWLNGDGANHLVIMNTSNSFTNPVDGNNYPANNVYAGSGEQVVYNGGGNTVNVTGLNAGITYYFRAFGFNGSGASSKYLTITATGNPDSVTTTAPSAATQLAILSVNGGANPSVNTPFSVVVQSQDNLGNPQPVSVNTTIDLSVYSGSGTISGGITSGIILANTSTVTITGVQYDIPDFFVSLEAAVFSGDPMANGQSSIFDVIDVATLLNFGTVPITGIVNTVVDSITVKAVRADFSTDPNYTGLITIAVNSGPGTITGTLTKPAVLGVATFNDIQFSATGTYTVLATATGLSNSTSSAIIITNAATLTELVVPKYIGCKTSGSANTDRTPIAVCVQIDNLVPNTSYDLRTGVDTVTAPATSYGGTNIWTGIAYTGNVITNAFTTDGSGSSGPYWIYIQPAASRFDPGAMHNLRLGFAINGSLMPLSPNLIGVKTITALDIPTTARTVSTADDGAFLKGSSVPCISGKYVLVYDNVAGTGDPLYSYQARQAVATNTPQLDLPPAISDVFAQTGTSSVGDYVAVIPTGANNPNGVRRIELRNADNTIFNFAADGDGIWPGGANTTTISRRSIAVISSTDAQLNTVSVTTTSTPASCAAISDGTATATATGIGTILYSWNTLPTPQTTALATGLAGGTYTVTVTDDAGCSATSTIVVGQPAASTITPGGPTTFCNGGSVTLSAGSGQSYSWNTSPVQTTQSIVVATSGSYAVTVDDGLGCIQTSAPVVVIVNNYLFSGILYSESMGIPSVTTLVNSYAGWQNVLPVTYQSTSASQSDVRTSNPSTTYPGFSGGGNIFFTNGAPIARNFIISGINTLGYSGITLTFGLKRESGTAADLFEVEYSSDGITYLPLSITQPATTAWGLVTAAGTIPSVGNLRLRFSKNNSQSFRLDDVSLTGTTSTAEIAASGPVNLCAGASVRLTSNIPSTNVWSPNGELTKSILVTAGASYSVTVTDQSGCTTTSAPIVVQNVTSPSVAITPTNVSCFGFNDGSASTVITDGTSPFSYSWNTIPVQTGSSATSLVAGNYTVVVTDVNGCSGSGNTTISQPTQISISGIVTNTSCTGNTGAIDITVTGGSGTYTIYSWDNGGSTEDITGLGIGIYTVTVTDNSNCTGTASFTVIAQNPSPTLAVTATPSGVCPGGTSTLVASGADSYSWSPATYLNITTGTTVVSTPSATITYTVTGFEGVGCQSSLTVTVTVNPNPVISITPALSQVCAGNSVTLTASGGSTYSWSPPGGLSADTGTSVSATPLNNTIYTVVGTSAFGCTGSTSATVNVLPLPAAPVVISPVSYCQNEIASALSATPLSGYETVWYSSSTGGTGTTTVPVPSTAAAGSTNYYVSQRPINNLSIAITGWNDNVTPDVYSFVALSTIPAGTVIYFTDNGWTGTAFRGATATDGDGNEGLCKWTAVNTVAAGSLILSNGVSADYVWATSGTIPGVTTSFTPLAIAGGGDQIYAFTSTALTNPLFNTAAMTHLFVFDDTNGFENATSASTGSIPPGLVNGLTANSFNLASATIIGLINDGLSRTISNWQTYIGTSANYQTVSLQSTALNVDLGCESPRSLITVNINSLPVPVIATPGNATSFCFGGSLTLDAGSGYNNYSWSNGGTNPVGSGQTYSATSAGTYTVTVTTINGCTAQSLPITISVNPAPSPSISAVTTTVFNVIDSSSSPGSYALTNSALEDFWINNSEADTLTLVRGITYTFIVNSPGHIFYLTTDAVGGHNGSDPNVITNGVSPTYITYIGVMLFTPDASTPNSLYYMCDRHGYMGSVINVIDPPATSGPVSVCTGDSATLIATGNYSAYDWNDGAGTIGTAQNIVVTPATTTTYTLTVTDANGCTGSATITVISNVCGGVSLTTTMMIEGYYIGGGLMNACLFNNGIGSYTATDADSVFISAMDPVTYAEVDMQIGILQTNGIVNVTFGPAVITGNSYYVRVQHRNTIETWSADPVPMPAIASYDFTSGINQAYGTLINGIDAMIDVGTPYGDPATYAFFSGDVADAGNGLGGIIGLQDGIIESQDYSDMENSVNVIAGGYIPTDITGDAIVESADYSIIENNVNAIRFSQHP